MFSPSRNMYLYTRSVYIFEKTENYFCPIILSKTTLYPIDLKYFVRKADEIRSNNA